MEEEQRLSYDLREELTECNSRRWEVVKLLAPWESPSVVATLKQTFATLWQRQQQYPGLHRDRGANSDAIAYELGRRGDFSLVFPDDFPDPHHRLAQLFLYPESGLVARWSAHCFGMLVLASTC